MCFSYKHGPRELLVQAGLAVNREGVEIDTYFDLRCVWGQVFTIRYER